MEDVKIVSVACGWRHSIAADSNGTVYTFGWSKYGQLGHGDTRSAAHHRDITESCKCTAPNARVNLPCYSATQTLQLQQTN